MDQGAVGHSSNCSTVDRVGMFGFFTESASALRAKPDANVIGTRKGVELGETVRSRNRLLSSLRRRRYSRRLESNDGAKSCLTRGC